MDDLVARIGELRRHAGPRGVMDGNTPQALAARVVRLQEQRRAQRTESADVGPQDASASLPPADELRRRQEQLRRGADRSRDGELGR